VAFGRAIRKVFPKLERKQMMVNKVQVTCYIGIKIRDKEDEEILLTDDAIGVEFEELSAESSDSNEL
jgi:hypothetical protein